MGRACEALPIMKEEKKYNTFSFFKNTISMIFNESRAWKLF